MIPKTPSRWTDFFNSLPFSFATVGLFLLASQVPILSFFLWFLIPVPLMTAGLSRGVQVCIYGAGVAAGMMLLVGSVQDMVLFLGMVGAPSILLVHRALLHQREKRNARGHWYPVSLIFSDMALYSLVLLTLFFIFLVLSPQGFGTQEVSLALMKEAGADEKLVAFYSSFIQKFLPSILTLNTFIVVLGAGSVSQKILQKFHLALRPHFSILPGFQLERWTWGALALSGFFAFVQVWPVISGYAQNVLVFLSILFFCQGLTLIHLFFRPLKQGKIFLLLFYFLVVVFGWPVLILTLLGIFEPWLKLKEKIENRSK